jgi:homoserine dehydrogenase
MKIQIIGLGNVGKSLLDLIIKEEKAIKCLGLNLEIVSISDSKGTIIDENGLDVKTVLAKKNKKWSESKNYHQGYSGLDVIKNLKSDLVVELTPSTLDGQPGLSHINAALQLGKNVVTANKGPLVVAYDDLIELSLKKKVKLLYEATVSAQLPIFCLLDSCFIIDKVEKIEGIFNATTNFIIGEIESGKNFEEALAYAIKAGWAETNYSDDVDGIDSARKLVILANTIYRSHSKLSDVKIKGIRNIESIVYEARKLNKIVKLLCELNHSEKGLEMTVSPKMIPLDDPFSTIKKGNMGIRYKFKNSQEIFVSAQFDSPTQTAYAVLNDVIKTDH